MNGFFKTISEMRSYLLLWATQMVSGLGSAMTSYALVIWSYTQEGSALVTAMLMVCTYAPYVLCSVFAGALSDRWDKKKILLVCDTLAAVCTLVVLGLLDAGRLRIGHLYLVNAISGLMNTVQQPASEVVVTAILPRKYDQKVGGLRYLSGSVNSILTPILATAVLGLGSMRADRLFEPVMAAQGAGSLLVRCFGAGKGSGAAFFFAVLWLMGIGVCLLFGGDRHIWRLEAGRDKE